MNRYIVTVIALAASITAAHADQVLFGRPGADTVTVWADPDAADRQSHMPLAWRDDVSCIVPVGVQFKPLPLPPGRTLNDAFKPAPVFITTGKLAGCFGYVEQEELRSHG